MIKHRIPALALSIAALMGSSTAALAAPVRVEWGWTCNQDECVICIMQIYVNEQPQGGMPNCR